MNKYSYAAIKDLSVKLKSMLDDVYEYYKNDLTNISFKVRPNYGYAKFYLNRVDGSYDMSLQALIHYMLYEHKHLKKILSKETYKNFELFIKKNSESLYDFGDNETEQIRVDFIEHVLICYMRCLFEKYELDSTDFTLCGNYELKSTLKHITGCSSVGGYVINSSFFYKLTKYLDNNELTSNDESNIIKIIDNIFSVDDLLYLAFILFKRNELISKQSIQRAINISEKNSEFSKIAIKVKELFKDENWIKEIEALKH